MPWQDRIREAAYTSPSGVRMTFSYEDVSNNFDINGTEFNFPDADGTYVQRLANSGRRYPLRVILWGDDYDIQAAQFESILLEHGTGKLEHPIYGTKDVVPLGNVRRRDDLKTSANQAKIEVTFFDTIGVVYPDGQDDPMSDVVSAVSDYNTAASDAFEGVVNTQTASLAVTFKNDYLALLAGAQSGLQGVADAQDSVSQQFNAIYDSITTGIDILVSDPLTLAFQTVQLIQAPARAATSILARLSAYRNLVDIILGIDADDDGIKSSNKFHSNDIFASTYVTGSIVSAVDNEFSFRGDAISAAEAILQQFAEVTDWRDRNYDLIGQIDTGELYQALKNAASLAAGYLVQVSFQLQQERSIVLDRPRTIIDLTAQLYGVVDDKIDFLISTNDLSGTEIKLLPAGREILYYA